MTISAQGFIHKATNLRKIWVGKEKYYEEKIRPFDLILFKGDDPVGRMISAIEMQHVEDHEKKEKGAMWTHVGVAVDKSVLPLDCMEDGKMYIYESILSGTVLGLYTYTTVMSVDHPLKNIKKESYAGPQLRPLLETVAEAGGDIAIAKLKDEVRESIFKDGLPNLHQIMLQLHSKYMNYTYPFNGFTQMAAASNCLYGLKVMIKKKLRKAQNQNVAIRNDNSRKSVFCSQFAAIIYAAIQVPGFIHSEAGRFTPIELDAMECFENDNYYIKHGGKLVLGNDGISVNRLSFTKK